MVTKDSVEKQLKKLKFNYNAWGRAEAKELPHIMLPNEEIYELVNGVYDGGFALLVATNIRLLLVDKKPLNFLTVEDMRFDMINEIDYSHRLLGARISISAGSKNLTFTSLNQKRLRKAIGHVQHCMAEIKKKQSDHQEDQKQHLEQINQQLQAYLLAQHQQQQKLHEQLERAHSQKGGANIDMPKIEIEPLKPSPELSDFLYAQSLLAQHKLAAESKEMGAEPAQILSAETTSNDNSMPTIPLPPPPAENALPAETTSDSDSSPASPQMAELYAEGMQEIFGRRSPQEVTPTPQPIQAQVTTGAEGNETPAPSQPLKANSSSHKHNPLEINPLRIAYSKLPMALRNRKFGKPSFHAHSQATPPLPPTPHTASHS